MRGSAAALACALCACVGDARAPAPRTLGRRPRRRPEAVGLAVRGGPVRGGSTSAAPPPLEQADEDALFASTHATLRLVRRATLAAAQTAALDLAAAARNAPPGAPLKDFGPRCEVIAVSAFAEVGETDRCLAALAQLLAPALSEHLDALRAHVVRAFEKALARVDTSADDYGVVAAKLMAEAELAYVGAAAKATPDAFRDAWPEADETGALREELRDAFEERSLAALVDAVDADDDVDVEPGVSRWRAFLRAHQGVIFRFGTMALNLAQARHAIRVARSRAQKRDEDVPKFPLF